MKIEKFSKSEIHRSQLLTKTSCLIDLKLSQNTKGRLKDILLKFQVNAAISVQDTVPSVYSLRTMHITASSMISYFDRRNRVSTTEVLKNEFKLDLEQENKIRFWKCCSSA